MSKKYINVFVRKGTISKRPVLFERIHHYGLTVVYLVVPFFWPTETTEQKQRAYI